jgi:hypothetical protein
VFARAQLLRYLREQCSSNQGSIDLNVTWEAGRVYCTTVDLFLILFFLVIRVFLVCVLNGTSSTYIRIYIHTHIHTYVHTYVYTYIHTYVHTHTHIHTYVHAHIYTCVRDYI